MKQRTRLLIIIGAGVALLTGTAVWTGQQDVPALRTQLSPPGELTIVRKPAPMVFPRKRSAMDALPVYNAKSGKNWQIDLRSRDISSFQVADRLADLRHADFDTHTRWPSPLPSGFNPAAILEANKNPGLGVRALHARGIDGRDVGIGIIDQALLVDHAEYRDRLRSYEELHLMGEHAAMHGPAVASIAVGKSVGIAPAADLYYIAETHGTFVSDRKFDWDFNWVAKSIDRLLEINATLPPGRRMRVISISVGWSPKQKGYAETMAAVERATQARVFVISTALEATHQLSFHGLGRDMLANPDRPASHGPGSWWADRFWKGNRFEPGKQLLVPMDARTTASPTGPNEYVYYANGGWSWSVPWIAGLYALACQVRPDITPELFWAEALRTGTTIKVKNGEEETDFGSIANPEKLLASLQRT